MAAIVCMSGPPCIPGKTALSSACACSSLQSTKPERGPASVLWAVEVTKSQCGVGFGWSPAATRPAMWAMSQRRSAPTSSAISRKRSASIVRGYAEAPQTISFGRCSSAIAANLVEVDEARLALDAVGRDVVEPAGEVDLEPVRQVPAVVEPHREDRVARAGGTRSTRPCSSARPRGAGRSRARRRRAPSRGRSRAARSRRRPRSRRSSAGPGSPRRTCSSARSPGPRRRTAR